MLGVVCVCNLSDGGEGRQEDPWGLLASQAGLIGELQAKEKSDSEEGVAPEAVLWPPCALCIKSHY